MLVDASKPTRHTSSGYTCFLTEEERIFVEYSDLVFSPNFVEKGRRANWKVVDPINLLATL